MKHRTAWAVVDAAVSQRIRWVVIRSDDVHRATGLVVRGALTEALYGAVTGALREVRS